MLFIQECWSILGMMSPWLLLGMLISGCSHLLLPRNFVRRRFRGYSGVVQSVLLGIPLPLCSCGVVPTGIGLKNDGADDGSAVGFLISTPQTGVDSILVSASFFGWPFAVVKTLAALVTGIAGGWLTHWLAKECSEKQVDSWVVSELDSSESRTLSNRLRVVLNHALEVFDSFWMWLLIGILCSAAIQVFLPDTWLKEVENLDSFNAMLIVLTISIPLYVCATASVPVAAALVQSGFPGSAALVFLMAGPATNLATIGSIYGRFGLKVTSVYLSVVVVGSLMIGWVFDGILGSAESVDTGYSHEHWTGGWWVQFSSVAVLGLFIRAAYQKLLNRRRFNLPNRGQSDGGEPTTKFEIAEIHCEGCSGKVSAIIRKRIGDIPHCVRVGERQLEIAQSLSEAQLNKLGEGLAEAGFTLRKIS